MAYYCCPFKDKYLIDYISKSEFQDVYHKAYKLLENSSLQDGHKLLGGLVEKGDDLLWCCHQSFLRLTKVRRISIKGWKVFKNYKKWEKAQKRLCNRLYSVYDKACKVPCKELAGVAL